MSPMTNIRMDNATRPAGTMPGMTPGVLTQVMSQMPSGTASVVLEMTMSVGVTRTGARVGVTPTTIT